MRSNLPLLKPTSAAFVVLFTVLAAAQSSAQVLYSQNFETDDTANWTINEGPTDELADFFFDYSTAGIPSAPNSTGGSTRGMKLQAQLSDGVFGGFSVSPNGQAFTGDYVLKFDWWNNYNGPLGPGGVGSTMLSQFGVMTSGTVANWPGTGDGVWFAADGDGQSATDYRAYSIERLISYRAASESADATYDPIIDPHADYKANSRNSSAALYATAFPGGHSAPAVQTTAFPDYQTGTTSVGAAGFTWNEVEISKVGTLVSWTVNDVLLITVDTAEFATPPGGENILFGHSDVNATFPLTPQEAYDAYAMFQFTLIDNVRVEVFAEAEADADFDDDGDIDGEDFLTWQRHTGISDGSATPTTGDATGEGNVNQADLQQWIAGFGTTGLAGGAASPVPEPATWCAAAMGLVMLVVSRMPRRRMALAAIRSR